MSGAHRLARLATRLSAGTLAACLLTAGLLAAPARAAAERFDIREWTRREGGETIRLDCKVEEACGKGSALSARLRPRPAQLPTVEGQKKREAERAAKMREENKDRIKDIEVGETKEVRIDNVQMVQTEKRVVGNDGSARVFVDAILIGPTRAYTLVSSGPTPELARANFESFARVIALILDQMSFDAPRAPLRR